MDAVQKDSSFELQIIATGTHLSEKFGSTFKEIENDNFHITKKIPLGDLLDSRLSMTAQVSTALENIASSLTELKPDLVVILGDRYEILGAAQAAFFLGIPLLHLHGGELTEGALDDSIRHCITKLSNYHITSTEDYKSRVIQLGENPKKVFCLGATGLENLLTPDILTKKQIEKNLDFRFQDQNLLITFHPVTAANENASELIEALSHFPQVGQIITLPNSDPGYAPIRKSFLSYASTNKNVIAVPSLGQKRYSTTMKIVDLVVGNSSSGIIEAPFSGTRSLNIGSRQQGRTFDPKRVTNVVCQRDKILTSLNKLLKEPHSCKEPSLLYGDGHFSQKFIKVLYEISPFDTKKTFFDLKN